jgi:tRNA pseudouridine32 synthase/23S rRNA pseudouridine746 synthase
LITTDGSCFIPFTDGVDGLSVPDKFDISTAEVHPLCLRAAKQLQSYLEGQNDWVHNFGLSDEGDQAIVGKMFGVLVVKNASDELGFLIGFSGKLAGTNQHKYFVPPIFDTLSNEFILNKGMLELGDINARIRFLETTDNDDNLDEISELKEHRKRHSSSLQNRLYGQYVFRNAEGIEKNLIDIFAEAAYRNPPAGAGECAAPKLLQYAFMHEMQPLALAEFWWGQSPRSAYWKHRHFYPVCKEKCVPILKHMLS